LSLVLTNGEAGKLRRGNPLPQLHINCVTAYYLARMTLPGWQLRHASVLFLPQRLAGAK
jgi:hypothetical protein